MDSTLSDRDPFAFKLLIRLSGVRDGPFFFGGICVRLGSFNNINPLKPVDSIYFRGKVLGRPDFSTEQAAVVQCCSSISALKYVRFLCGHDVVPRQFLYC